MSDWEYGVQHIGDDGKLDVLGIEGDYFDQLEDECVPRGCYRVRRTPAVEAGPWERITTRESAANDPS